MKNRISFYMMLATAFGSGLLVSCHQVDRSTGIPTTDTIPVVLQSLQTDATTGAIEATGTFTTQDETLLGFKSGGVIDRIYVREGDLVKAGQLLARVHADEVNARVSQATLAEEKAQRDYQRAYRLYKDSVATLEQMENAKTALDVARQDLKSIQFNQQYVEIRSTHNGYVLARLAQEGQVVGPGTPVLQVNGANEENWELKVGVSDKQWAAIRVGDSATVQADALGEGPYSAVVSKKAEGLDPNSGTFSVFVKLKEQPKGKIAAGLFAKAQIIAQTTHQSAWHIPYTALLDGNGKEGYVFVTGDGRVAKRVKVDIAAITATQVVVSSGLEGVKALVVSGSPYLVDGSPIRVVEENK
ncbi:efflux RND transporter periplasmic adaptor subunit [Sphingobacterium sp. LRF_L2]|uniref:efflux RND transporter periplasmic adaptor subunit n=1 Tax=Sphingobacterium sp. LRF_L2 TaxID=3369421 RepID=UPI003F61D674